MASNNSIWKWLLGILAGIVALFYLLANLNANQVQSVKSLSPIVVGQYLNPQPNVFRCSTRYKLSETMDRQDVGIVASIPYLLPVPKVIQLAEESQGSWIGIAQHLTFQSNNDSSSSIVHDIMCNNLFSAQNLSNTLLVRNFQMFIGYDSYKNYLDKDDQGADHNLTTIHNNEQYSLNVSLDGTITIGAVSTVGIRHAINTLMQILDSPVKILLPLSIMDWPINHWRGLLVDLARHFQPIPLLKRCVDAMAAAKLNVLHLHITDSQSFPLLLDDSLDGLELSQLARRGSFDFPSKTYTKDHMKELVQYAMCRGIEVIPEIDMPAHALSWNKAFASIVVQCHHTARAAQTPHNIYPLDPSDPMTIRIITAVLKQVAEIFPSPYLHVGGDEVDLQCWRENENLTRWAKEQGKDMVAVFKDFEQSVFSVVKALGKTPVVWQGVVDADALPTSAHGKSASTSKSPSSSDSNSSNSNVDVSAVAVIEPWKCWSGLAVRAALQSFRTGNPVVMSACWYLDYDQDWTTFLATDLIASAISSVDSRSAAQQSQQTRLNNSQAQVPGASPLWHEQYFPGGEGAMWTEMVDHTNLECRMWPRAAAIATRLWGYEIDQPLWIRHNITTSSAASRRMLGSRGDIVFSKIHSPGTLAAELQTRKLTGSTTGLLGLAATKYLLGSLVHFRHYLTNLGLSPAPVVFHLPDVRGSSGGVQSSSAAAAGGERGGGGGGGGGAVSERRTRLFARDANNNTTSGSNTKKNKSKSNNKNNDNNGKTKSMSGGKSKNFAQALEASSESGHQPVTPQKRLLLSSSMHPEVINDELAALRRISDLTQGMQLSSSGMHPVPAPGSFSLTAQCLGIPESVQRPIRVKRVSLVQLNVLEGSTGMRGDHMLKWLQAQANAGVLAVGFCELNGWQELQSSTDLLKNFPKISFRAANAGFAHSHVMSNSQPYNIGIVSALAFEVKGQYGPKEGLQRGMLHVYYQQLDLHVMIVHLHAHNSASRVSEALLIAGVIRSYGLHKSTARLVVMGDFNTLSPWDRRVHNESQLVRMFHRSDNEVFARFGQKYLSSSGGEVDYRPMQTLLSLGLHDSCVESCRLFTGIARSNPVEKIGNASEEDADDRREREGVPSASDTLWSLLGTDALSQCMQTTCQGTEPTLHNPEWPATKDNLPHPQIRVDYMLVSEGVLRSCQHNADTMSYPRSQQQQRHLINYQLPPLQFASDSALHAEVEITNKTAYLSDHFPVKLSWQCELDLF